MPHLPKGMAAKRKTTTKKDLEAKIAELEEKLTKLWRGVQLTPPPTYLISKKSNLCRVNKK